MGTGRSGDVSGGRPVRRLLTGRKRAKKEGYEELQALQEELMKYTRLAYPEADIKTTDTLVLE